MEEGDPTLLPAMRTDVTLTHGDAVLIIDAKYYESNTQQHFDRHKVHSGNMYQIFTYVTNRRATAPQVRVCGMLLYARTACEVQPEARWHIGGSDLAARTLDLNQEFSQITAQLDGIAREYFPGV